MAKQLLLSLVCCLLLQANDKPQTFDLSDLSFEELMNIPITSTSRREESQKLAPGIITLISSQEIAQYGARHLRDVLDRVVGTQILGSHQRPHNKSSIRAMNGAHQDGSVLILLNGRPVHDGTDSGFNFDIYLGFPLNIIDHIEVIRGPGSVIYGTNAMAGVINIITKDAKKSVQETQIDISAGSFDRTQLQLSTLLGGSDYSLNIGINAIRADGQSVNGILDQDNDLGSYGTNENSDNIVINGQYKGFTLNAMVMNNAMDSGGSTFALPSSLMKKRRNYLDVGYLYDIASGWDVSLNHTTNLGEFNWQVNESGTRNHYRDRYDMTEVILRGNINTDLNVLAGVNSSDYETVFDSGFPYAHLNTKGAYTQIDYMLSPKQKIIGGIQLNKSEDTSTDLSKRAGFIQGFDDNWWLKLLYSEAYRSPNLQEAKINAATLKGNPLLDPEKVATYDAQLIYQTSKQYFAIALYDSMLKNIIIRVPGSPTTFANSGYVRFQGIELKGRQELNDDFSITGNFSYQTNKTSSGIKDSTFAPNMMAKLGISYSGIHGMNIAVFNSFIGESTDLNTTNNVPLVNPKADAYNLLTANVSMDLGALWGIAKTGRSLLSLYLDNILDEEVYTPNLNYTNGNNTIPHHWGRSANLTYTYKF